MSDMPSLTIQPVAKPIRGRIRPPGSKSITNRALVCAALAQGTSTLTSALDSEDTRVMIESLGRLGIKVESHDDGGRYETEARGQHSGSSTLQRVPPERLRTKGADQQQRKHAQRRNERVANRHARPESDEH